MRVITTDAYHQIVEFAEDEALPTQFDQASGVYHKPCNHAQGAPGRTYIRTQLAQDTQIKIWRGLIDASFVGNLLATDQVAADKDLYGSSVDGAMVLTLASGLVGVFKPARSDDPTTGTHWSEITAYEVDRAIGLNCVPITVHRDQPESGSIQLWVDGLTVMDSGALPANLRFFDKLIANSDRGGNLYPNFKAHAQAPNGCVAFDNGCSFLGKVTGLAAAKAIITPAVPILGALVGLQASQFQRLPKPQQTSLQERITELRQLFAA